MGNCYVCKGKGTFGHLGRQICKSCFIRIIEIRIKKSLERTFNPGDNVFASDELSKHILKSILKKFPIKFVSENADKVIVNKTANDINNDFINRLISSTFALEKNGEINLFSAVTDEEMILYGEIIGIPFTVNEKSAHIETFFKKLNKYKEISCNLSKNVKELHKIL